MQQLNKAFHSSPYFNAITALDYHQMLCLLCSDFPKKVILDAIEILEPTTNVQEEAKDEDGLELNTMFCKYKLGDLQKSVAIFFYYSGNFINILEFIENLKKIFQEAQSSSKLDIDEEISAEKLLICLQNYLQRVSKTENYSLPSIESIMETLACAAGLNSFFEKRTVAFAEDISELLSDKISYKSFCQNYILNYKEIMEIFKAIDQSANAKINEKLKDIINQYQ